MASLERRKDTFRVVFRHGGRKYGYSLDTADRPTAEGLLGGVEKTLMLLGQGILALPDGGDVVAFVRSGGAAATPPKPAAKAATFAELRAAYLDARSNGAVEANTLVTLRIHLTHLAKTFGERFRMDGLTPAEVQRHVDRRLRQKHRGRPIGSVTARKEVTTLRAMWRFGLGRGLVAGPFSADGLTYPKSDAKLPFMTLAEVERRIAVGGLGDGEREALYESLYLRREEIDEMLDYVRAHAAYDWVHPLVATAALTGARRSELLRMEVTDVDFDSGALLVREKKRSKKQRTTRHVTLSLLLAAVLRAWLAAHPGGRFLFCRGGVVGRSKKRSGTTGHAWGAGRPTTTAERLTTVVSRPACEVAPVTKKEVHDHFKRTLAGSRWAAVRGLHTLRYSFISCLAAAGVDQRVIDEFVGHSTDEQRRRYRHLIPDVKQQAMAVAFG